MNVTENGRKFSPKRKGYMVVEKAGFPQTHERRILESQYRRHRQIRRENTRDLGIHAVGLLITLVVLNALFSWAGGYTIFTVVQMFWFWVGMMMARTLIHLMENHEKTGHAFYAKDWTKQ